MGNTSWQTKKKYNDKTYTQFNFRIPKEIGDPFKEYCKKYNISMNELVTYWIKQYNDDHFVLID